MSSSRNHLSTSLRAVGVVAAVSSIAAAAFVAVFASSPLRVSGVVALGLLVSALASVGGGIWMFSVTKNPWWFLTLLPVVGGLVVWLLVALMVPLTFH